MKNNKYYISIILMSCILIFSSCRKENIQLDGEIQLKASTDYPIGVFLEWNSTGDAEY